MSDERFGAGDELDGFSCRGNGGRTRLGQRVDEAVGTPIDHGKSFAAVRGPYSAAYMRRGARVRFSDLTCVLSFRPVTGNASARRAPQNERVPPSEPHGHADDDRHPGRLN